MRRHLASLVEDLQAHAAETAVVLHRGVRRYPTSYGEVAKLAGRFAAELDKRGIRAGERVVLCGENSAEWLAVFFGCLLRGVLAVPLDASGSPEFMARVIAEVTPRLIVGDASLIRKIRTDVTKIILDTLSTELSTKMNFEVAPGVEENAPFQIIFTSGTTSEPKGIVHTHRNVLASLRPIETEIQKYRRYERWFHPLRFLHTLPLSHVFGQFMGLWIPVLLAAELHFVEGVEPHRSIELIRRERISVLVAVPRVLGLLQSHLLRRFPTLIQDLHGAQGISLWRRWWNFRKIHRTLGWKFWAIVSGGAQISPELEHFWNRLGFALIQGYGMTETAALVTLNHPFRIGQGTIGKALPGREVRLSDSGEILVRGDMVSRATWQQGRMFPRTDEWLATGDLAEKNESGDFRFLGRQGDVIVTANGLNIHPVDLETAMKRQSGVRACAVVPCRAGNDTEPVCVVLFSGDDRALQEAVHQANKELMEYQQIRRVLRWPDVEFPYTSTGKLLRRKIEDWACDALRGFTPPSGSQTDSLIGLISEITGFNGSRKDDALSLSEDLFLDSLGRVQLAAALEQRLGIELGEEEIVEMVTLGDLRRAVGNEAFTTPSSPKNIAVSTTVSSFRESNRETYTYPYWPWSWPVCLLRNFFLEMVERPLTKTLLNPSIKSVPEIPSGPLLIISNHVTAIDAALVLYALPGRLRRRTAIAMSGEMLQDFRHGRGQTSPIRNLLSPAAYWLLTALFNVFPLPRSRGVRQSFAHAGEALNRGYSVLIFPEGTRNKELKPFRQGTGLLASQSQVPVLPVALIGMETLRPGIMNWFRKGHLQIRIGAAIPPQTEWTPSEWTSALEDEMGRLLQDPH
jgi:long-chain acyl-CoA synthetase